MILLTYLQWISTIFTVVQCNKLVYGVRLVCHWSRATSFVQRPVQSMTAIFVQSAFGIFSRLSQLFWRLSTN